MGRDKFDNIVIQLALGDRHLPGDAHLKLPNAERAVVDPAKVRDYLLSPEHPLGRAKARFFAAVGFTRAAWPALQRALLDLAAGGQATLGRETPYGQKYEVRGMIQGPVGGRPPS